MGRAIVRFGEDEYVEWSTVVDAPVSYVLSRSAMLEDGVSANRLDRADLYGHSYLDLDYKGIEEVISCNRAGPKECCLTLDAIRRRFANQHSYESFILTVEDIKPFTTYDDGKIYWIPWPPGGAPDVITEDTNLHAMVLKEDS